MRVLWAECKKICNLKALLLTLVLGLLLYGLFPNGYIGHLWVGRPTADELRLSLELVERYGGEMDQAEFEEFKRLAADTQKELDGYVKNNPSCKAAGIDSWAELQAYEPQSDEEAEEMFRLFDSVHHENMELSYRVQVMNGAVGAYEQMLERVEDGELAQPQTSVMPGYMVYNQEYLRYAQYFIFMALVCVIVLVSPLVTRDKRARMRELQYTAHAGRGLLGRQLLAVLLAAFALITVLAALFVGIYLTEGTSGLFGCEVAGFQSYYFETWFPITFGQVIAFHVIMMYLMGLGVAAVSFFLSWLSPNHIVLAALQLPVVVMLYLVCQWMIFEKNGLFSKARPVYTDPAVTLGVLLGGLLLAAGVCLWEKRRQIA